MDIGRNVAALRVRRGLTQERFAESVLEVSLKYLQRVEAGRENLTVTSLVKLETSVGVAVEDLMTIPRNRRVRRGRPPKTGGRGSK